MTSITDETLEAMKAAHDSPSSGDTIEKGYTQATGLVNYDLERPAKYLVPLITPLRNMIPRVKAHGGVQANWKAITKINKNKVSPGVSEGQRGGVIDDEVKEYMAAYRGIGLEHRVTFEATYAAAYFDDVKRRAVLSTLHSVMIQEEKLIIGGNGSLALGVTPTPTLSANATGGSLTSASYNVACVALTADGLYRSSVIDGVPGLIVRNNADGTTDSFGGGSAQKSGIASVVATAGGTISATVTPKRGAVAYAWFWGTAGAETLGAITTVASVLITATATGTQNFASLPAADNSINNLVFDGLITQISRPDFNAFYYAMPNTVDGKGKPLTADGAAGIDEIDMALAAFWDNHRLSPDTIWVSAQEHHNITKKIVANNGAPLIRIEMKNTGGVDSRHIAAGAVVGSYLNSYGMGAGEMIQIRIHPDIPRGTMIFYSSSIPYQNSNVSSPIVMRTRQEYYQIEWPLRTRSYEYGVYTDEVLQNYFPPAFGIITNIGNG